MCERFIIERDRHDGDHEACLLEPTSVAAGAYNTPTIHMKGFERALFCVLGGAVGAAAATLDLVVYQCTTRDNSLGDAKVLAGIYGTKAIAQETSGTDYAGMNQKWLIEVKTEEMDVDNHFDYLFLRYTVAAQTWLLAIEAVRSVAHYEPTVHPNIDQVVPTTL